jgi:hypothetical protein
MANNILHAPENPIRTKALSVFYINQSQSFDLYTKPALRLKARKQQPNYTLTVNYERKKFTKLATGRCSFG